MKWTIILLDTFGKIKRFVNDNERSMCTVDVNAGRYMLDGKSIMNIFSLDLSVPLEIAVSGDSQDEEKLLASYWDAGVVVAKKGCSNV